MIACRILSASSKNNVFLESMAMRVLRMQSSKLDWRGMPGSWLEKYEAPNRLRCRQGRWDDKVGSHGWTIVTGPECAGGWNRRTLRGIDGPIGIDEEQSQRRSGANRIDYPVQ